jgi:thiol peroxidase
MGRSSLAIVMGFALAVAAGCGAKEARREAVKEPARHTDLVRRGDKPLTIVGDPPEVGAKAPDATLRDDKLEAVTVAGMEGPLLVLSVVPSIDTRVCEAQTHRMSDSIAQLPAGTVVATISRDLPFAQRRFAEEAATKTRMLSDYKERDFGRAWGLEVAETGLLARSVWVVDRDGTIVYRELVADQSQEPDYDAMIAAVQAHATP